jgi:hypothetical protein
MSSNTKISYFNTLVFTIITGVASLVLLSLLFFDIGKEFIYFIITFEIGIFVIIAYCITKIILGEMSKKKNTTGYVVSFDQCPEYYVKENIEGVEYCNNEFTTVDKITGRKYLMKLFPAEINNFPVEPEQTVIKGPKAGSTTYDYFPMRNLENDPDFRTMEEKCNLLFKAPTSNEDKYKEHTFYTYIPWTYAKSRCQSLANV